MNHINIVADPDIRLMQKSQCALPRPGPNPRTNVSGKSRQKRGPLLRNFERKPVDGRGSPGPFAAVPTPNQI